MANTDTPRGFINPVTDHGGSPQITWVAGTTTKCYPGDALQYSNGATESGQVIPLVDAQTDIVGVCAGYHSGTDLAKMPVYSDLKNMTFEVQTDDATFTVGTLTILDIGQAYDVKVTTGDTTRLTSKHELMSSTDDAQFLITELIDRPDNDSALVDAKVRGRFVKITNIPASQAVA